MWGGCAWCVGFSSWCCGGRGHGFFCMEAVLLIITEAVAVGMDKYGMVSMADRREVRRIY